ncbi:hypothetical protein HB779_11455 [Phyllobacterium sp. 628]|uniref:hypothetical protein n=1 Tax=Phyllobacterium sp. 628 TaxID=2718938 RepID=UPI00166289CD|nr:hypothetical protein [Phyllobacterium sp. 628]QND52449.1 hypothetical protein HB779_11455 [Phyllobacterium sp. 628]
MSIIAAPIYAPPNASTEPEAVDKAMMADMVQNDVLDIVSGQQKANSFYEAQIEESHCPEMRFHQNSLKLQSRFERMKQSSIKIPI